MSHRREQIASVMHRAVQDVFTRGLNDPRIRGMVTVSEVTVSSDLREATVHVSILPAEAQAGTMQGLVAATMRIQHMVNEKVDMRRPPHIKLRLDERIKKQAELLGAIRDAIGGESEPEPSELDDIRQEFEQIARPTHPESTGGDSGS